MYCFVHCSAGLPEEIDFSLCKLSLNLWSLAIPVPDIQLGATNQVSSGRTIRPKQQAVPTLQQCFLVSFPAQVCVTSLRLFRSAGS